jgi:hypothetical protein
LSSRAKSRDPYSGVIVDTVEEADPSTAVGMTRPSR